MCKIETGQSKLHKKDITNAGRSNAVSVLNITSFKSLQRTEFYLRITRLRILSSRANLVTQTLKAPTFWLLERIRYAMAITKSLLSKAYSKH